MLVGYGTDMDSSLRRLRRRRVQQLGQLDVAAGASVAATESAGGATPTKSIAAGVTTGVLVFLITRILDRVLFGGGR